VVAKPLRNNWPGDQLYSGLCLILDQYFLDNDFFYLIFNGQLRQEVSIIICNKILSKATKAISFEKESFLWLFLFQAIANRRCIHD